MTISKPFAESRRQKNYNMSSKDGPDGGPDDDVADLPARARSGEFGDSLRTTDGIGGNRNQRGDSGSPKFRLRPTPNLFTDLHSDVEEDDLHSSHSISKSGAIGDSAGVNFKSDFDGSNDMQRETFGEVTVVNEMSRDHGTPELKPITGMEAPSVHDLMNSSLLLEPSEVEEPTPTAQDSLGGPAVSTAQDSKDSKDSPNDPLDHTFG